MNDVDATLSLRHEIRRIKLRELLSKFLADPECVEAEVAIYGQIIEDLEEEERELMLSQKRKTQ